MGPEQALGYAFKDKTLLKNALTHTSFYHENRLRDSFHNERLELLGDSVLGLVIAEALYLHEPSLMESEMARIKSYLVSGEVLAQVARGIDLGRHVFLGKGELGTGGRGKASILADALESLFGAIYIDGGFGEARRVIRTLFLQRVREALSGRKYLDHKTELQELCQARFGTLPVYATVREEGVQHRKTFTVTVSVGAAVLGSGCGLSKKSAEIEAARNAFIRIQYHYAAPADGGKD